MSIKEPFTCKKSCSIPRGMVDLMAECDQRSRFLPEPDVSLTGGMR